MKICKDVLVEIFKFLSLKDFLNCFLVSNSFYEVSKMEYIWKIKFFECKDKPINFKVKTQTPDHWIKKIKIFNKNKSSCVVYNKIRPTFLFVDYNEIHEKRKFLQLWYFPII